MRRIKNVVGPSVRGKDFWGRDSDIKLLTQLLDDGAHVSIVAQRRIGKTSLMQETGARIDDRFLCLHLDLQDGSDPADLIVKLSLATRAHARLWEKTKTLFGNTLSRLAGRVDFLSYGELTVTLRADLVSEAWQEKGQRLLEQLAAHDQPVVLFIDELPILISKMLRGPDNQPSREGRRQVEALLTWLRARSLEHQDRLRFVLAGSLGFEPVLSMAGLSATLNTFTPLILDAWDVPTALGCLQALANNYHLELQAGVPEEMLTKLGYNIPHHVQMFFQHMRRDSLLRNVEACSLDDVQLVYKDSMLSSQGQMSLAHMEERLTNTLPADMAAVALDMLSQAAVKGRLTQPAMEAICRRHDIPERKIPGTLRSLINMLEHDGYLKLQPKGYVFVSNLLRDWWRARYVGIFKPVVEER